MLGQGLLNQLPQSGLERRAPFSRGLGGIDNPAQAFNISLLVRLLADGRLRWHIELDRQDGVGLGGAILHPFPVKTDPKRLTLRTVGTDHVILQLAEEGFEIGFKLGGQLVVLSIAAVDIFAGVIAQQPLNFSGKLGIVLVSFRER